MTEKESKHFWNRFFGLHSGMKVKIKAPHKHGNGQIGIVMVTINPRFIYVQLNKPIKVKTTYQEMTIYMGTFSEDELEVIEQ